MTSMVGLGDDDPERAHDPFDGNYIEVDEAELRLVAGPQILLGRVRERLDEFASAVIYGR